MCIYAGRKGHAESKAIHLKGSSEKKPYVLWRGGEGQVNFLNLRRKLINLPKVSKFRFTI